MKELLALSKERIWFFLGTDENKERFVKEVIECFGDCAFTAKQCRAVMSLDAAGNCRQVSAWIWSCVLESGELNGRKQMMVDYTKYVNGEEDYLISTNT